MKGGAARAGVGTSGKRRSSLGRGGVAGSWHWWEPCAGGLADDWQAWLLLAERVALGLPRRRVEPGGVRPGGGGEPKVRNIAGRVCVCGAAGRSVREACA